LCLKAAHLRQPQKIKIESRLYLFVQLHFKVGNLPSGFARRCTQPIKALQG